MRTLVSTGLTLAAAYTAVVVLIYFLQDNLVYFPTSAFVATPADRGLAHEEVTLTTDDGVRLHGWYIPAPGARAVLLYFHGNAGNISYRLDRIGIFHRMRLSVLIIDYRGYGISAGKPSEEGMYQDAMAAWRHLTVERGVAPDNIIVFGRSLGAAVAAWLATQTEPGAVVLESGFTSVRELGAAAYPWLPVRWLSRHDYPVKRYAAHIRSPLLVIHSREDEIVPFRHGQEIFAAANDPKSFMEIGGGHNDAYFLAKAGYADGLDSFLRAALSDGRAAVGTDAIK